MIIAMTRNGSELKVALEGRLDTLTSPELEDKLEDALEGVTKLIFDLKKLDYISSAGLRVIACAMETMEEREGEIKAINVCSDVRDVFEITGFSEDLGIE